MFVVDGKKQRIKKITNDFYRPILFITTELTLLSGGRTELSISGPVGSGAWVAGVSGRPVTVGRISDGVTLSADGASFILGISSSRYSVVPSTTWNVKEILKT